MRGGPYWIGIGLLLVALRVILRVTRHASRFGHVALVVDLVLIGVLVVALIVQSRDRER